MTRVVNIQKGRKGFITRPLLDRIMEKIKIDPATKCWNWNGSRSGSGYGMSWHNGQNAMAHRCAYELFRASIPDDRELDHLCKNKVCVNPNHLEAVSHSENMLRAFAVKKTQCKRGHKMIPENTYVRPSGAHECRSCRCVRDANLDALDQGDAGT